MIEAVIRSQPAGPILFVRFGLVQLPQAGYMALKTCSVADQIANRDEGSMQKAWKGSANSENIQMLRKPNRGPYRIGVLGK